MAQALISIATLPLELIHGVADHEREQDRWVLRDMEGRKEPLILLSLH